MLLLLQLNGDLPERFPNDERWLYIFGCPRKACSRKPGSIRALRGLRKVKGHTETQRKEESKTKDAPPAPKQDIGAVLFGTTSQGGLSSNVNPFSTSSSPAAQNNPFAPLPPVTTLAAKPPQNPANNLSETFAAKARISTPEPSSEPVASGPVIPWPDKSAFPPPYTEYYLDADYETLSRPPTPTIPTNTTVENIDEEAGGAAVDPKDAFESSMDKDFLRFSTRLAHNPEQVLRYEFAGTPLLYSGSDAVAKAFPSHQSQGRGVQVASNAGTNNRIPRCPSCGRERVFELQLVPHTIAVLEDGREGIGLGKNDAGMEWGTIILGVCAGNCGTTKEGDLGWREEWVGVQWEDAK